MENVRPDSPTTPERIGRYQLVTEIGTGPLGPLSAAYVSAGAEEGRIVAIRRVPIPASEREAQQRVSRAGIGAMSIRHARLAAVLDVLPGPISIAVISEYVESASLRSLQRQSAITRAPLQPPVAVAIAADVLRALRAGRDLWRELSAADRDPTATSIHGGLLPDSVSIASFGETMLCDLGVAGAAASIPSMLRHPEALPYRAPEQLAGDPPDERADVYAIGVLLWEMLANRPLFGAAERFKRLGTSSDVAEVEREIRLGAVPRLNRIERTGAPMQPMLVEIVHECLAREPTQRFPTVDAVLDALRTLSGDLIAQPEQISVAINRLMRNELEARRVEIELVAGLDRVSVMPESARSTARPPPPEPPMRFEIGESPTLRTRRQTPKPDAVPAAAAPKPSVPPALRRITAGTMKTAPRAIEVAAKAEPLIEEPKPAVKEPSEVSPALEVNDSGVRSVRSHESQEPSGGLAVTPLGDALDQAPIAGARRSRKSAYVLAGVIALAALIALALARGMGRSSTPTAATTEPSTTVTSVPTDNAPKPVKPQVAPAAASSAPLAPTASESERAVEPPRAVPPSGPGPGKKPYRPHGI